MPKARNADGKKLPRATLCSGPGAPGIPGGAQIPAAEAVDALCQQQPASLPLRHALPPLLEHLWVDVDQDQALLVALIVQADMHGILRLDWVSGAYMQVLCNSERASLV